MTHDEIKRTIQSFFTDDIALIIGSGLSCSEGLPSMGDLASHLSVVLPLLLNDPEKDSWAKVAADLSNGIGLEQALGHGMKPEIFAIIAEETAKYCRKLRQIII